MIAAECGKVFQDPLETGDHVQQAIVRRNTVLDLGAQLRVYEESTLPYAVGDAAQHNSLLGEHLPAVGGNGGCAACESSTVDPHKKLILPRS